MIDKDERDKNKGLLFIKRTPKRDKKKLYIFETFLKIIFIFILY